MYGARNGFAYIYGREANRLVLVDSINSFVSETEIAAVAGVAPNSARQEIDISGLPEAPPRDAFARTMRLTRDFVKVQLLC
jgi:hypothetical protein